MEFVVCNARSFIDTAGRANSLRLSAVRSSTVACASAAHCYCRALNPVDGEFAIISLGSRMDAQSIAYARTFT